jgi:hypothetical protein
MMSFASAIESHVRAETVAMCRAKLSIELVRLADQTVVGFREDWSAVDAAVKEGGGG